MKCVADTLMQYELFALKKTCYSICLLLFGITRRVKNIWQSVFGDVFFWGAVDSIADTQFALNLKSCCPLSCFLNVINPVCIFMNVIFGLTLFALCHCVTACLVKKRKHRETPNHRHHVFQILGKMWKGQKKHKSCQGIKSNDSFVKLMHDLGCAIVYFNKKDGGFKEFWNWSSCKHYSRHKKYRMNAGCCISPWGERLLKYCQWYLMWLHIKFHTQCLIMVL